MAATSRLYYYLIQKKHIMDGTSLLVEDLFEKGFSICDTVYSPSEVFRLTECIHSAEQTNPAFRRSADLFAIRRFLKVIPDATPLIWNKNMMELIQAVGGKNYFVVKSIYFDKPALSNWFVSWHQDLTIAVDRKAAIPGFSHWTEKQGQIAVQPPVSVLENILTIRIHLDDCDESNGALRVLPGTHQRGILRPETLSGTEPETCCNVKAGGVMLMKPLLMHSSRRSESEKQRRVIHIELSDMILPQGLNWSEQEELTYR